jgi:hypothetical protein
MASEEEFNHFNVARAARELNDVGVSVPLGAHGQREGLGVHWELWMLGQGGMKPLRAGLEDLRNSATVRYTMVNGRLYDAATMNEVGNTPRERAAGDGRARKQAVGRRAPTAVDASWGSSGAVARALRWAYSLYPAIALLRLLEDPTQEPGGSTGLPTRTTPPGKAASPRDGPTNSPR